ncbi:MAG TPA: EAL domain-containing response regulator [Stellaceae bacterium]|jgi:EAL domain-containing protein (putative c-di-GMP-specific phosphodiesterase class I)|nr:EAL domain-containing response regulator [Stellaceae bacterium]
MDDLRMAAAGRLIVIDDDPGVGIYVGRVARRAGFDVIVTADPADFKQRVRSWHPAVIILDLGMPEIDGVELLRFLADERVAARILILSGFDDKILDAANRLGTARGLNMAGVLRKPVLLEDLSHMLRRVGHDVSAVTALRLAEGLDAGELFLEYQPKIALDTMRPVGVEALLRWRHPELGLVPPMNFIPAAEETDLIHRLTQWVLSEALRQHGAWSDLPVTLSVAVNLSAKNVDGDDLADLLSPGAGPPGFEPRQLILELTETAAMRNAEQATDMLTRLRIKGVGLSIDDFGTGYSSLSQLQRLPFSEVKIDKSFVMDCVTSKENAAIVYAVIDLSHRLGLKVVAEGVETADALRLLAKAGCDGAQGYFISKPIGGDKIPAWIEAHQKVTV